MLIDTTVFERLEKPWFKTVNEIYEDAPTFRPKDDGTETILKNQGNEDSYFCKKVKDAGFKIFAHGGVLCPHWNATTGVPYTLPINSYPVTSVKKEVLDAAKAKAEV